MWSFNTSDELIFEIHSSLRVRLEQMTKLKLHLLSLVSSGGYCRWWKPGSLSCSDDLAAAATTATGAPSWRLEAVHGHPLSGQLWKNIVQVVGVGEAVTRQVGHHLCLVMDPVPHHGVGFSGGARRSYSEDEPTHPRHLQKFQNLFFFLTPRKWRRTKMKNREKKVLYHLGFCKTLQNTLFLPEAVKAKFLKNFKSTFTYF